MFTGSGGEKSMSGSLSICFEPEFLTVSGWRHGDRKHLQHSRRSGSWMVWNGSSEAVREWYLDGVYKLELAYLWLLSYMWLGVKKTPILSHIWDGRRHNGRGFTYIFWGLPIIQGGMTILDMRSLDPGKHGYLVENDTRRALKASFLDFR